jgi:hypothetical protein
MLYELLTNSKIEDLLDVREKLTSVLSRLDALIERKQGELQPNHDTVTSCNLVNHDTNVI